MTRRDPPREKRDKKHKNAARKPKKKREHRQEILRNKKAFHDYLILERLEAGLVLRGSEVKSLRERHVAFADSFVRIQREEAWLMGLQILPYANCSHFRPDPTRKRKLLLNRREIDKLHRKATQAGHTIVPLCLYFKDGLAKVEIALVKGKRQHDKREVLKKRDAEREMRAS